MALKNHALDGGILLAAQEEFLEKGYENASLRSIAASAGVTIGAIYTRYSTKDKLFGAVVQPLTEKFQAAFQEIRSGYYGEAPNLTPEHMAASMRQESDMILHLLFDDYERAELLFCRSAGSSLEGFFDQLTEAKIRETIAFFRAAGMQEPDEQVLRLLVSGQLHMYIQILRGGCDLETAKALMQKAMVYHTGGWMTLLNIRQNLEGKK